MIGHGELAPVTEGQGDVTFDYAITGIGQTPSVTEGVGDFRYVHSIDGIGEHAYVRYGSADLLGYYPPGQEAQSTGVVSFVQGIDGVGDVGSTTEGTGDVGFVFSIAGNSDTYTVTEGNGGSRYDARIRGRGARSFPNSYLQEPVVDYDEQGNQIGQPRYPARGTVNYVFSIDGAGQSVSVTEGTGGVASGAGFNGHGEVGTATEGTGTVELIPTMALTAVVATPYFTHIASNADATSPRYVCTASLTLTLPATPDDGDTFWVKTTAASVTIAGNGKNIDGSSTYSLASAYDSVILIYTSATGEWLTF